MSDLLNIIRNLHEGKISVAELDRDTKHMIYKEFIGYDSVEQYLLDKDPPLKPQNNKEASRATISRRKEKLPIECIELRRAKRVPRKKHNNNENI